MELLKIIGAFILFMVSITTLAAIFTAVNDKAIKIFRPEIFNERRQHEKALNKMRRERDKALLEIQELKNKMNTFTFTQPKIEHNVYIKSNNDYQV